MKIYRAEKDIERSILDNRSISYIAKASSIDQLPNFDENKYKTAIAANTATPDTIDLFYTQSVLVTTNWNRNDDIFDPREVWAARKTPVDKPTNIEHDHDKIIGHITSQWAIDEEGNIVDNDLAVDEIPDNFHVCVGGVIYKAWANEETRDQVSSVINNIEKDEMYVSMECIFSNFDYGMNDGDDFRIVERNDDTSYLTKHLSIYGGAGEYNGFKLGRILRNIVFSGKGYVKTPANPHSIIFSKEDSRAFNFVRASNEIPKPKKNGVYISNNSILKKETNSMSDNVHLESQIAELKSQLDKAKSEAQAATDALNKAGIDQLNSKITDLTGQLETSQASVGTLTEDLKEAKACNCQLTADVDNLKKEKQELADSIAELKNEKLFTERVSTLVSAGIEKEDAVSKVEKFKSLDDEQFAEVAKVFITEARGTEDMKKKKKKDMMADANDDDSGSDSEDQDPEDQGEDNADASLDDLESSNASADVGNSEEENEDDNTFSELQTSVASFLGVNDEDEKKESK